MNIMRPGIGKIWGINGPVLTVHTEKDHHFFVGEMVKVGNPVIFGEVIALGPNTATVQVYESTSGLTPDMLVEGQGKPLSITLHPGIVGHIFDGVMNRLDEEVAKTWDVNVLVKTGQFISEGDIFAETNETAAITYKATVPPNISGIVKNCAKNGAYAVDQEIVTIETSTGIIPLSLTQIWPIRFPRPVRKHKPITCPLITGQRVIDSLFPIAKGGVAAIPGGFGTGKTMTQHQLAKFCDADLIVYIGCGERGNEMTEVLEDFAKLTDPRTNQPLLARTILIANTSDMPVAAREASIYTGISIAEGYRDMGYHVALMADSTSRWAEALRELSGRLGEIPMEEGYPAYLATRLSAFYGRAGYVQNLNGTEGSITIVGAVSPQGADFSEPVTQHTKRFVRTFWALDRSLAYARHYPAIHWMQSYSGYLDDLENWYYKISPKFIKYRNKIIKILQEEHKLLEIVKLIGTDALAPNQQEILKLAKQIRENFLQQNAYDPSDTFTPIKEQFNLMEKILGE